jgi:PIN domain nuclease of toxin-antitoxin system
MSIKAGLGKLGLSEPVSTLLGRELPKNKISLLEITLAHSTAVESLPPHHRDPFDRMLAVQTKMESLSLVSNDAMFDAYGVPRIW